MVTEFLLSVLGGAGDQEDSMGSGPSGEDRHTENYQRMKETQPTGKWEWGEQGHERIPRAQIKDSV